MTVRYLLDNLKVFINFSVSLCLWCLMSIATTLIAQEQLKPVVWLGLHGGISMNDHHGNFNGFTGTARCGTFTSGSGNGFFLGHLIEWNLNDVIALSPRMTYSTLDGTLKAPDKFISVLPPDYNIPTLIQTEHTLETKFSYLAFEGLVKITPLPIPFAFYGGAGVGIVWNKTFTQDENIVSPSGIDFTTSKKINGDIPDASSFRASLLAGAAYDIYLDDNIILAPEIMYNFPLTNVGRSLDWKISSLHVGMQFKFGIPRTAEPKPEPPKKEEPPPPPPPPVLSAKISAKSQGTDGTMNDVVKIVVEETQTTEMFPLLPYIFFTEGNSDVPSSKANLTKSSVSSFDQSKIARETMAMYEQVLNIIGSRMKKDPSAKLVLSGVVGSTEKEKSNPNLALQRASSVKKYFTDVWDIQPDRIMTKIDSAVLIPTSPEWNLLEEEARRVVISSDMYDVLAPIIIEDVERKVTPPKVFFIPEVTSQVGLTDWAITVRQDNKSLKNYNGKHTLSSDYEWEIEKGMLPLSESPIEYTLDVNDQASQHIRASGSIPVQQLTIKKKKEEHIGNIKIERYRLILFAYNSAQLGPINEHIVAWIRDRISPNATIKIDGYTDHVGSEDHNMILSSERAKNVRMQLGNSIADERIEIRANGESDLFDNTKPEGRYFCRTVYITVETPSE